jgi:hypothetical protein
MHRRVRNELDFGLSQPASQFHPDWPHDAPGYGEFVVGNIDYLIVDVSAGEAAADRKIGG